MYFLFPEIILYVLLNVDCVPTAVIGCELSTFSEDDYLYLSPLEVIENSRGKGYGTALLNYVKNFSKLSNFIGLRLICSEKLVFFYSRRGFTISSKQVKNGDYTYTMTFENK